jgi:hypothetical protein
MIEIQPDEVVKVTVSKEPISGYVAWYKLTSYPHWTFLANSYANSNLSLMPYPLFKTTEDIVIAVRNLKANIDDITIKALKVTL